MGPRSKRRFVEETWYAFGLGFSDLLLIRNEVTNLVFENESAGSVLDFEDDCLPIDDGTLLSFPPKILLLLSKARSRSNLCASLCLIFCLSLFHIVKGSDRNGFYFKSKESK